MAWYMDFRFKIQWATKESPVGSLLLPEPDTDIQCQQRPITQRPRTFSSVGKTSVLQLREESRTGITAQKWRSPCGKTWRTLAVSGFFFSVQRKIYPQKIYVGSHWISSNNRVAYATHFVMLVRTNLSHTVVSHLCCLPPTS